LPLLIACSGTTDTVTTVDGPSACDGLYQLGDGDSVDAIYDRDGDGYLDQYNSGCVATYGLNRLDCDDDDPGVHPDAVEITCNDIDDDCNEDTPDLLDRDLDGTPGCYDCDDDDPAQSPIAEEKCWDEIDNNCDGHIDEDCGLNYSGRFDLSERIRYNCLIGLVNINFDQVGIIYDPPAASLYSVDGGQPGTMSGAIEDDGTFTFTRVIDIKTEASCAEHYEITGVFSDEDNFTMDFEARFVPTTAGACIGCDNQRWTGVLGSRAEGSR
ncbi:MAG: putative metal-binding motif-containing protein, partial [Phycisphaerales bacterium]|nr:putative metal-binding motif-containing protein [Phycisphaerales bacterium]